MPGKTRSEHGHSGHGFGPIGPFLTARIAAVGTASEQETPEHCAGDRSQLISASDQADFRGVSAQRSMDGLDMVLEFDLPSPVVAGFALPPLQQLGNFAPCERDHRTHVRTNWPPIIPAHLPVFVRKTSHRKRGPFNARFPPRAMSLSSSPRATIERFGGAA